MGSLNGIIVLDKPPGISSALAVDKVKRLLPKSGLGRTKIGHAGTLDPFATGVLLLLIGKATKQCESLMDQPKQYDATVKFGATTVTDDLESPEQPYRGSGVSAETPASCDTADQRTSALEILGQDAQATLIAALARFVGEIQQRPPAYSAMKIGGRRAYELARKGQSVELEPRTVRIYGIELLEFSWPTARLRIDCGRGTYIRSIARDLGEVLGVGGYLTALRRTRVGEFGVDRAVSLEQLERDGVETYLLSAQK